MDGPIDWWWKMNLLNVCIQAGFCEIRSHMYYECLKIFNDSIFVDDKLPTKTAKITSLENLYV